MAKSKSIGQRKAAIRARRAATVATTPVTSPEASSPIALRTRRRKLDSGPEPIEARMEAGGAENIAKKPKANLTTPVKTARQTTPAAKTPQKKDVPRRSDAYYPPSFSIDEILEQKANDFRGENEAWTMDLSVKLKLGQINSFREIVRGWIDWRLRKLEGDRYVDRSKILKASLDENGTVKGSVIVFRKKSMNECISIAMGLNGFIGKDIIKQLDGSYICRVELRNKSVATNYVARGVADTTLTFEKAGFENFPGGFETVTVSGLPPTMNDEICKELFDIFGGNDYVKTDAVYVVTFNDVKNADQLGFFLNAMPIFGSIIYISIKDK